MVNFTVVSVVEVGVIDVADDVTCWEYEYVQAPLSSLVSVYVMPLTVAVPWLLLGIMTTFTLLMVNSSSPVGNWTYDPLGCTIVASTSSRLTTL